MTLTYLVTFLSSILLSFVLTRYVRNKAVSRGWLTASRSFHDIHSAPIPRLGGVAIFFSFITVISALIGASVWFQFDLGLSAQTVFYILASGTLVFLLGLYDDVYSVKPYVKLVVQSVATCLLFFNGIGISKLPPVLGSYELGWLALPLTILWVLWITNAFNLIDGLDGLAAGSALFSTMTVFVICLIGGNSLLSLLTVALAGAILGFLRFNFNPATIFLGDCGSLFIGFMLSALALAGSQKAPTLVAVAIPVVSFGLPILETTISVIRRFLNGHPLFGADLEHIHHKLLARGFSQRQTVIILYGVSAMCALLSLFLLYPARGTVGIVLFVLGAGIWLGVQHLGYHEFFELRRVASRTIEQKRIIINNIAIRKATEALAKVEDFNQLQLVLESAFAANDFDGFHFRFVPPSADLESISEQLFDWRKNNRAEKIDAAPAWTLRLELVTSQQQRCGFFNVYRTYVNQPLLVDVNLLIAGFPTTLADAACRAMSSLEPRSERVSKAAGNMFAAGAIPDEKGRGIDLGLGSA